MSQIFISKPYARSKPVELHLTLDPALCIYRDSPFSIQIQIRTHTDKSGRISNVGITAAEAREIGRFLLATADELLDEKAAAK